MSDVYVNALTTVSTEPTTTDSLVVVNRNTNEGKIIDYNLLADVILNKIASKQFSGLDTTSKLLVGAINELDSDVSKVTVKYYTLSTNLTASETYESIYQDMLTRYGTNAGMHFFTGSFSGQLWGGICFVGNANYGAILAFQYSATLRFAMRVNSTEWTLKTISTT